MDFHENPRFLRSHFLQSGDLKIVKSLFSIKNGVDVLFTTQTIHLAKRKWSESRHPDFGGGDLSKNSKKSGFGGGGLRPKNRSFLGGLKFIFLQKRSSSVYLPPMYPYITKKVVRKSTSRFLRG